MTSLFYALSLLSLLQSLLTVAWYRLLTADLPLPLSSRTVPDPSYQFLTETPHNN
jgi:hypothetical protein